MDEIVLWLASIYLLQRPVTFHYPTEVLISDDEITNDFFGLGGSSEKRFEHQSCEQWPCRLRKFLVKNISMPLCLGDQLLN